MSVIDDSPSLTESGESSAPSGLSSGNNRLLNGGTANLIVGQQLALSLRGHYLYVSDLGWLRWDGMRWAAATEDQVLAASRDWVDKWLHGQMTEGNASVETLRGGQRYLEIRALKDLLHAARLSPAISARASELDAQPWLLNAHNGTVDLRTGELLAHDPAMLITKLAGARFLPGATHPDWTKVLSALPDAETQHWLRRHMGAAATGVARRGSPMTIHYGDGSNGKSAVFDSLKAAFGDYATQVPLKLLTAKSNEHDTMWMTLRGVRLATMEGSPEGNTLPVERIKQLVDTAEITARKMHHDYVTFLATHTVIVSTNHLPRVTTTDHGTWRRMNLVEYIQKFEGASIDATIKERMMGQGQVEAVLAWLVEGAAEWIANGRHFDDTPQLVLASTSKWRADSDVLGAFLNEALEVTRVVEDRIPTMEIYTRFLTWAGDRGDAWTSELFINRLRRHGWANATLGLNRGRGNRDKSAVVGVRWIQQSMYSTQG